MKVDPRTLPFVQCPTDKFFHYRTGYRKKNMGSGSGLGRDGVLKYTLLYSRLSILLLDMLKLSSQVREYPKHWVIPEFLG